MRFSTFALVTLALLMSARLAWAEWYQGIVHVHTTFSDGSDNIPQRVAKAKRAGCKFLVVTDHYEQIASSAKTPAKWYGQVVANPGVDIGFKDYRRNCDEQTLNGSFVTIPGAEVQTVWHAEPSTIDYSHTLALGNITELYRNESRQPTSQRDVIAWINRNGLLAVAAHPVLISTRSATSTPWERQRFRYDRRSPEAYEGLKGIEFFNSQTAEQDAETLSWYLGLLKKGQRVFVTSGCDSHGWKDPSDSERWQRRTYVYIEDKLTSKNLLGAIRAGRTIATAHGAKLSDLNCVPGTTYAVDRPVISFRLEFGKRLTQSKSIHLYRDGKIVAKDSLRAGESARSYRFEDTQASTGLHLYTIVVEQALVTSPICLRLTAKETPAIDSPITVRSSYGDGMRTIAESVGDFELDVEIEVERREGAIFFRLSEDRGDGYGVTFCPFPNQGANPGLYIVKRTGGREQTLAATQVGFPKASGKIKLEIRVTGASIEVLYAFPSGAGVLAARDGSFSRGELTARVYGDKANPAGAKFKITGLKDR